MGILGNIFTASRRRKARKKARRLTQSKQRTLQNIMSLTDIKQQLQRTQLADRLHDAGLQDSSLGNTLRSQLSLTQTIEDQQQQQAADTLDIERLNQKNADVMANLEGIDAALGVVLASVAGPGGAQAANQPDAKPISTATVGTTVESLLKPGVFEPGAGQALGGLLGGGGVQGGIPGEARTGTGMKTRIAGVPSAAATPEESRFISGQTAPTFGGPGLRRFAAPIGGVE